MKGFGFVLYTLAVLGVSTVYNYGRFSSNSPSSSRGWHSGSSYSSSGSSWGGYSSGHK